MTRSLRSMALLLSGLVLSASGWAQTQASNPWVRATVPQQRATGLFVELQSPQGSRLIGGSSPLAGRVEIHEMRMEGEVMRMRAVDALDLPAGQRIALRPGAVHLMLLDLKSPAQAGAQVPVTLHLVGANGQTEKLEIKATVRPLGGTGSP